MHAETGGVVLVDDVRDVLLRVEETLARHMEREEAWQLDTAKALSTLQASPAMRLSHENVSTLDRITKRMQIAGRVAITTIIGLLLTAIWEWGKKHLGR